MVPYQIFADATCGLTPELTRGLPPIEQIPMQVEIGGRHYTCGPGGDLTTKEFYALQRQGNFASTTQIAPGAFLDYFEPVLKTGRDLIYFPLTSGLSGTYQSAMMCLRDLKKAYPERKMLCVDTFCASVGQGFLLREIAGQQAQGLSIEELAQWVEENSLKVCHWFTVDTFDHLKHGGRVSAAVAVVGTALQIKPMLKVDGVGRLEVADKPRGRRKAIAALVAKLKAGWLPEMSREVLVGHGDAPEAAEQLKAEILAACPDARVLTAEIDPVIGSHTGPGMLAIIYWGSNR